MSTTLDELVAEMANRDGARAEATVQAGIRQFLLTTPLNLDDDKLEVNLEAQAGGRLRIDIEVGATVIEVKKDLRVGNVRSQAVEQLKGYVESREKKYGSRYVGVLTDGAEWRCYYLKSGQLEEVSALVIETKKPDVSALVAWLEGVLATRRNVKPVPDAIRSGLGFGSSAHALDRTALLSLFMEFKTKPEVQAKRHLWARLLTAALGTQFEDSDELFVEHTLLVNSASIIAHALLEFPVEQLPPASVLSGAKFEESGIYGVVEADFFDWVLHVPGGDAFVRTLARRLGRFDWRAVEHDVLKVLYESIIAAETRKKLGEYYTPDWLAQKLVEEVITDPLTSKVLDPACGSGTFVFHAIRRYLVAAENAGITTAKALNGVIEHVSGMDLHPVAVTLARVTYLLAIGPEHLSAEGRSELHIPVYLGDSMQWNQWKQSEQETLWSHQDLTITADDKRELHPTEFKFPRTLLKDFRVFDGLVKELSNRASCRKSGSAIPSLSAVFQRHAVLPDAQSTLTATFRQMCRLHDEGRDHIWGYYIRNLAHPQWLAQSDNRVDILIGNPPWLAYRYMPGDMQADFQAMSQRHSLWHGGKLATQQDLSALFAVRTVQLYLKPGGRLAYVMPSAVLDRGQYRGFREGAFDSAASGHLKVAFSSSWDLRKIRPHFFPITAAVVFGRQSEQSVAMPATADQWSGKLPNTGEYLSWEDVSPKIKRKLQKDTAPQGEASPYKPRFRNGATVVPRVLFMVEKQAAGPLGQVAGRARVKSIRSANEKAPWKSLPSLEGVVETEFLRPMHLGETLLPYRMLTPPLALIPRDSEGLMDARSERLDTYPGLAHWWRNVEELWDSNRSSERLALLEQLDYHQKLSAQFPTQEQRIVYTKSGMHVAAARLNDPRSIIDHTLYWATAASEPEALYLCAILNSVILTALVRPLMAYGKDERHVDKHLWKLPIPLFDAANPLHGRLAVLGGRMEEEVATLAVDGGKHFAAARRKIREHLETSTVGRQIEEAVEELLTGKVSSAAAVKTPRPPKAAPAHLNHNHLANKLYKAKTEAQEQDAMNLAVATVDDWLHAVEGQSLEHGGHHETRVEQQANLGPDRHPPEHEVDHLARQLSLGPVVGSRLFFAAVEAQQQWDKPGPLRPGHIQHKAEIDPAVASHQIFALRGRGDRIDAPNTRIPRFWQTVSSSASSSRPPGTRGVRSCQRVWPRRSGDQRAREKKRWKASQ
jgi:hypothetical protein